MTSSASLSAELALSDADNVIPGIVIQSALFGILTLLISISTITMCRRGIRGSRPRQFMMTASLAMYIASGMHWVLNVYAAMRALRDARAGRAGFSIHTLYVLSEVGSIALFFNFWISDMVVMWRACVLWGWCLRVRITFGIFVIVPAVLAIIDVSTTRPAATDTIFEPNIRLCCAPCFSHLKRVGNFAHWIQSLDPSQRNPQSLGTRKENATCPGCLGASRRIWLSLLYCMGDIYR